MKYPCLALAAIFLAVVCTVSAEPHFQRKSCNRSASSNRVTTYKRTCSSRTRQTAPSIRRTCTTKPPSTSRTCTRRRISRFPIRRTTSRRRCTTKRTTSRPWCTTKRTTQRPPWWMTRRTTPKRGCTTKQTTPKPRCTTKRTTPRPPWWMTRRTTTKRTCTTKRTTPRPKCATKRTTPKPKCTTKRTTPKPKCTTKLTTPKPKCTTKRTTPKPKCTTKSTTPKPKCTTKRTTPKPKCTTKRTTPKPKCTTKRTTPKPKCITKRTTPKPKCTTKRTTPKPKCTTKRTTPKPKCTTKRTTPKPKCTTKRTTPKPKCTTKRTTPKPKCTTKRTTPKPKCTTKRTTPKPKCTNKPTTPKPKCPPNVTTPKPKIVTKNTACPKTSPPNKPKKICALPCRKGFIAVGSKCYRLVRERMDWHSAALYCGAHRAGLARFDSNVDKALEEFFQMIPKLNLQLQACERTIKCEEGKSCNLPEGKIGLSVKVQDSKKYGDCCQGKVFMSADKRQVVVKGGCKETFFVVETVDQREYKSCKPIVTWVGGNTKVLKYGQRKGKTPFQVDPPQLLEAKDCKEKPGCFQAIRDDKGHFMLEPNENCLEKLPFVCGYDNAVNDEHDPNDFLIIKEEITHADAVIKCNEKNRPLASITTVDQQNIVVAMIKGLGKHVWISAKYSRSSRAFQWGDGSYIVYSNWKDVVPREVKAFHDHHCASVQTETGAWDTEKCCEKLYALCGPEEKKEPLVFTPFYPVDGYKCIYELKEKLRRLKQKDYICEKPELMECSAKTKNGRDWITSDKQTADTIECSKDLISCKAGKELDCSTFRVRFLCPREANQCTELEELGAPACGGGQECSPAPNHYQCRCPPDFMYSEMAQKCVKFCGECSAWGDPHFETLAGNRYDFMGTCKYKFTGVCNKQEFCNRPNFDIYTTNVLCTTVYNKGGTCISDLEVQLRNIVVHLPCGSTRKEDFLFKIKAKGSSYQLNGKTITDQVLVKEDAFKAVVRPNYFSLVVYALDLKVLLNYIHLRVRVPDRFRGKLCGLCGDCGTDKFRLRNGTAVDVDRDRYGLFSNEAIKPLALDWMVRSEEFQDKKCGVLDIKDTCTREQKNKVAHDSLCGIFNQKNNALQKCFDVTGFSRHKYFTDCVYDLCETQDPEKAVCGVLQAFAQQCTAKGVLVNWRTPDFCPMKCGRNMVYRADASGQRECGMVPGKHGSCDEEPAEGCVCKDGLYLLGDRCVPKCQCGCRVMDMHGNFVKYLQPGESAILPGCTEKVTCEKNIDGTLNKKYVDFVMPPNSVCTVDVPPKVACARGFQNTGKDGSCKRKCGACKDGFSDKYNMCVRECNPKSRWKEATSLCNKLGATILFIDTAEKINVAKEILKANGWKSMYVTGRVKAISTHGFVTFKPVVTTATEGSVEWANDNFYYGFLEKVSLSDGLKGMIPKEGRELSIVAEINKEEIAFKAVPSCYTRDFVCEQF